MVFRTICMVTVLVAMSSPGSAQGTPSEKNSKDMHGLMIYGDGFLFLASEPEGWDTDTGKEAQSYGANAVFFPRAGDSRAHRVRIRVRLNRKTTEDPLKDMMIDIDEYRNKFPSTQFADVDIKHPEYMSSVKLFYTPGEFFEYVAYLNPGSEHSLMFSISMSKEKEAATPNELAAFQHVLRSLRLVSVQTK